jgi:predicted AlkP superfamily pyrophosphatase or phosphodiesterase
MFKVFSHSCLLIWVFASGILAADRPQNRVVLIGIDGCRTDALQAADPPNLDRLIAHGAFSGATNIVGTRSDEADTVSGPGWSNILTGVWADKHGVTNNAFKVKHYDEYPHFFVHVKHVFPGAHTHSYCVWPPIDTQIVAGADESICFARDEKSEPDCAAADARCAAKAVDVLKNADPDVMFVYFENVDATGHGKGFHRSVPEYIAAIKGVDVHVGEVLSALRSRPKFKEENWLILVGTDHGGRGTGHGGGRESAEVNTVWLIVSGDTAQRGMIEGRTHQVDLVATALTHLEVPIDPEWGLDGKPVGLQRTSAE